MPKTYILTVNRCEFAPAYEVPKQHNVYCMLKVGDIIATTTIAEDCGKYPHWNEQFQLDSFGTERSLIIEVYESPKKKGKDILLGRGALEISTLESKHGKGSWIDFTAQNKTIGTIIIGCEHKQREIEYPKGTIDMIKALPLTKTTSMDPDMKKKELPSLELQDCSKQTRDQMKLSKKKASSGGGVKGVFSKLFASSSNKQTQASKKFEESKSNGMKISKGEVNNENVNPREYDPALTEIDLLAQPEDYARLLLKEDPVMIGDDDIIPIDQSADVINELDTTKMALKSSKFK